MRNAADTMEKLESELLDIVAEEAMVERAVLTRDAALTDLDIASADFVMVLMAIEERYGVYISIDNELADLKTVDDLLRLASEKISAGQTE